MLIDCKVEKRISKAGNEYTCLYIPLLDKIVMLEKAEIKLIQVLSEKK